MAYSGPVHSCDPALLGRVITDLAVNKDFVRLSLVVGIVHVKRQGQAVLQLNAEAATSLLLFPGT